MARWQGRSLKKATGGRIWPRRSKRKREMGSDFVEVKMAPTERLVVSASGWQRKVKLYSTDIANVTDPATGKTTKSKILTVVENRADPHFVRRNVITKGAIINTEMGKARVTSRPGQHGAVNALLLEKK
ncbi:MAG: 30S ribosomal protein S8e [Candidatus Hadarchaeota archaeon]